MDTLLEKGDLRVRLLPDELHRDIRAELDGLPHELREFDPHSYGRDRREAREVGGPLFDEYAWFLRRSWWRDDPQDWVAKVFRRYVEIVHGGVVETVGRRTFYLLPEDAGGTVDKDVLRSDLVSGVDTIRKWEDGEVYSYVVERLVEWARLDDLGIRRKTWEHEDSCGGYIGYEHAVEAATEAFEYAN
ncbi:hypothetical protein [Micromonospora sp. WMMD736]|uniref:hypothetical protein n=1 Tax=Micromonospora sp. WMMD736 TaxID=3404112 RepID=UPI003B92D269